MTAALAAPAVAPTGRRAPAAHPRPGRRRRRLAVRRAARTLHATCAELLPGYAAATREPWRQALLTAGCLDGRRPAPGRAAQRARR